MAQQLSLLYLSDMPNLIEIRCSLRREEGRNIRPSYCKCILWPFVILVQWNGRWLFQPRPELAKHFGRPPPRSAIIGREITIGNTETVAVVKLNSLLDYPLIPVSQLNRMECLGSSLLRGSYMHLATTPLWRVAGTGNHCIEGWVDPRAGLLPPGFDPWTAQSVPIRKPDQTEH